MIEKWKGFLFTVLWLASIAGCGNRNDTYLDTFVEEKPSEAVAGNGEEEPTEQVSGGLCYVYVCGAVAKPGVYVLSENSRVYEAIEMAGGLTEEAQCAAVNQAEAVTDGQLLYVPTVGETEYAAAEASDGRININTATAEELMTIPGVGKAKADSIIAYREEHGAFSSAEDLMNVAGIKEGVFNRMRDYIKVN